MARKRGVEAESAERQERWDRWRVLIRNPEFQKDVTHGMEVKSMKMVKLLIQVPQPIKATLDAMRTQGYTVSGYIRALLERELTQTSQVRPKGK